MAAFSSSKSLFLATLLAVVAAFLALDGVRAHADGSIDLVDRVEHAKFMRRSLDQCSHRLNDPEMLARRELKHKKFVAEHLTALGFEEDHATRLAKRSASNVLLPRQQVNCVLSPELSIGPYFVQKEQIRNTIAENQRGIPMALDLQFFDIEGCRPIPELYVDIWHCNSTGIYSGVRGMNTVGQTFYRGVVKTDEDGIAHISSNVPGWYNGRALHIHVLVHWGGTVTAQGTYEGGRIAHTGQIFFPESLLTELDNSDVYRTNTARRMLNSQDQWWTQTRSTQVGFENEINISRVSQSNLWAGVTGQLKLGVDLTRNNKLCDADSNDQLCWTGPVQQVPYSEPPRPPTPAPVVPQSCANPVPKNNQCGGQTYTGSTCCASGTTCTFVSQYYSQCR